MSVMVRGSWPGPVTLRQGWSKASARPWNEDITDAQLRLERGSRNFIRACTEKLLQLGTPAVVSAPVPPSTTTNWTRMGFRPWLSLEMFRRDLAQSPSTPADEVATGDEDQWNLAASVDRVAFEPLWRLGKLGLEEAKAATPRSAFLVVGLEDATVGFAVVGLGQSVGYLQRVAVQPDHQGKGLGRSLVRASLAWARNRGARTMLLNTQPDNEAAASLYLSEGFRRLPQDLQILRRE